MTTKLTTAVALELFKERAEMILQGYSSSYKDMGSEARPLAFDINYDFERNIIPAIRALPTSDLSDEAKRIMEDAALGKRLRAFVKGCDNAPGTHEEMMSSGFDEWSEAEWHALQDAARKEKNDG